MADTQDQKIKRPAKKKVNPMTKCQRLSRKLTSRSRERARVNIGNAFGRWRALKAANGLRSDAEVAQCLLDERMKRVNSNSDRARARDKKMKFSRSEMQTLIRDEVRSAGEKNEAKLKDIIETFQQLDRDVDYESSIQKLEARIDTLTHRAQVVLDYITKKNIKSPRPSCSNVDTARSDSEDEAMETESMNKKSVECKDKSGGLFQIMETSREGLKKMKAENKALTAAIADLSTGQPPVDLTPYGSSEGVVKVIKNQPESHREKENNVEESKQFAEPVAVTGECISPGHNPKHTGSEQDKLGYPPLPTTTFPSVISMQAASYNIPQRLDVHVALIRKHARLSVLWKVKEADPSAPPMDSYSVYLTMEKVKGSGIFPGWSSLGEIRAIGLPMCAMISKYKPGYKVCVAVVGKDVFGRYGPYSNVVSATIPE